MTLPGGVANLEVLDEQRLGDELRREAPSQPAAPCAAQPAGLAVRRRDSVGGQANQELLGTPAIGDDRRVRRQPRMLEPRREMRAGEGAAEPKINANRKTIFMPVSSGPRLSVSGR